MSDRPVAAKRTFRASISYAKGAFGHAQISLAVVAPDEEAALARIGCEMQERQILAWRVLAMVESTRLPGPYAFGAVSDDGSFGYPCGCRLDLTGTYHRCSAHRSVSIGDDALVEAIMALGLLFEPRPVFICANCQTEAHGRPLLADYVGRWSGPPRDWESEDWRSMKPSQSTGRYDSGTARFCSRRCRGEWLIKTADDKSVCHPSMGRG